MLTDAVRHRIFIDNIKLTEPAAVRYPIFITRAKNNTQ